MYKNQNIVYKNSLIFIFILAVSCNFSCITKKNDLDKPVRAEVFAKEYALDIEKGNKKYNGKYITVTGEVWQSYTNRFDENIIILMSKDSKYGVKCFLSTTAKSLDKPLKQGEIVKLNGKCNGMEDFIILKNCVLLKN